MSVLFRWPWWARRTWVARAALWAGLVALACVALAACGEHGKGKGKTAVKGGRALWLEIYNEDPAATVPVEIQWGYAPPLWNGAQAHPSRSVWTNGPIARDIAPLTTIVVILRPLPDRIGVRSWPNPPGGYTFFGFRGLDHTRTRIADYDSKITVNIP